MTEGAGKSTEIEDAVGNEAEEAPPQPDPRPEPGAPPEAAPLADEDDDDDDDEGVGAEELQAEGEEGE